MICRIVSDVMFCEQCAPRANIMLSAGIVGPRSVFDKACPHVEIAFLAWHEELRAKESPLFRHVWQPFCIGLLLGAAIVAQFIAW